MSGVLKIGVRNGMPAMLQRVVILFFFGTAWSTPEPIIKALSVKYPDVTFEVEYADEDVGNNVGSYSYKSGEQIHFIEMSGSQQGLGLAISLLGLETYFEFVDGQYRRKKRVIVN
ncbi:MAG: hypothetical protein ACLRXR_09100 [Alistipes putredinis]